MLQEPITRLGILGLSDRVSNVGLLDRIQSQDDAINLRQRVV